MLAHNVFFSLIDASDNNKTKLIQACMKYLSSHPGTVFFGCGTLATELRRPVNDLQFDIGLHIIFQNKAAHDAYQEAPQHLQFIDENKGNWKNVRVFDSLVG
jgi:hypothetical protein